MKYTCEITINLPMEKAIEKLENAENDISVLDK